MTKKPDNYVENPYVFEDRRKAAAQSEWVRSFSCVELKPLIVCRGPIRKEALDVFSQMGMTQVGVLLSEKDSIVYPNALAPELRVLEPERVHRVPDYSGATKEERVERVQQIISIAHNCGYNAVFAGYGFMAEDEDFVLAIEGAGLKFIGPCSRTVRAAGRKDEAKRTALREDVSVTPGIDNATARTLVAKCNTRGDLLALADKHGLEISADLRGEANVELETLADDVLNASYRKGLDLISIDEICAQVQSDVESIFVKYPGNRIRLKAIGGGGGKGQRILEGAAKKGEGTLESRAKAAAAVVPEKAREVLAEVKTTGVGDNKNMLIELNIEQTRHHEIQLVGNGEWCVTLGGRDCSLQMHEQKLLEISITQEALKEDAAAAKAAGRTAEAESLQSDLEILTAMEEEAARFGAAVGLDSASTFECIVDMDRHFFMEVNTRIQVEHRVSELCYGLRFANPEDDAEAFVVNSLVEMMAMLACHKQSLPRPTRVRREAAAAEVRLNATDRSLSPHAGGIIRSWSEPLDFEIRDDQGICMKNPDTGLFMRYNLAGAYDSNIALLVTVGSSRHETYDRLFEILRQTSLRGNELATNLEFHFGLVSWFRSRNVHAKPTTRFVVPYLTQVGLLKEEAESFDFALAYDRLQLRYAEGLKSDHGDDASAALSAIAETFARKRTLLLRVVDRLVAEPHYFSAWLSENIGSYTNESGRIAWNINPLEVVANTYALLNLESSPGRPAAHSIWDHDAGILDSGLEFYREAERRLFGEGSTVSYRELDKALAAKKPPSGFDAKGWSEVQGAHLGYQAGLELLELLPLIAIETGFFDLKINEDLSIEIPERLFEADLQARMGKVLVPPPATKADEIVAERGGMFYSREAPHLPPLVQEGDHFEVGQRLYVLEVMKMFNKVCAPFSGTIDKFLLPGGEGVIIQKGQPIFKVTPDVRLTEDDVAANRRAKVKRTELYLSKI